MGIIKLNNIRCYAYHGCLVEEGKIGSDYRVDLLVEANLHPSALSDDLNDTVDYVHLNKIVVEEMDLRAKLLETVAQRILNRVQDELQMVNYCQVEIAKLNPPIGGDVASVSITMDYRR